ncbi:MAG: class I SAM-dependent methyltransferase [Bacteroidota bacterium]
MPLLTPAPWPDYELLDSGGYEKLERFGKYVTTRPEPQAVWPKLMSEEEWENQSHAIFRKDKGDAEKGRWMTRESMPDNWYIGRQSKGLDLRFKLSLSSFKHVGLFPEQAVNWDYIAAHLAERKAANPNAAMPKVLNLFAYTGGASLAAKALGADVVHVDSVKQVLSWGKENMLASGLDGIRWLPEDAMKFVKREERRGTKYQGLILDPPAYGRGPEGEKWQLEDQIFEMLQHCANIIDPDDHFFIINLYSLGFSALILENLMKAAFGDGRAEECGELYLPDSGGRKLPLGTYYRFRKVK